MSSSPVKGDDEDQKRPRIESTKCEEQEVTSTPPKKVLKAEYVFPGFSTTPKLPPKSAWKWREESKPEGPSADIVFEWLEWLQKPPTGDKASVKATENNFYSRLVKAKKIEKRDNEIKAIRSGYQLKLFRWRELYRPPQGPN
jgi:hypothetical protein